MKYRCLLIVLALSLSGNVLAQQFFSTDKTSFLEQLTTFLCSSTSKQDREAAETLVSAFAKDCESYYTANDIRPIVSVCEVLRAKSGHNAYAGIFTFVEVLHALRATGMNHQDANNWICYTESRYRDSAKGFDKYIAACRAIFIDKVLASRGNSRWEMRDARLGFPTNDAFQLSVADATLALCTNKDVSLISNTSGSYDIDSKRFAGCGGRVDWTRFDIPSDRIYADLPERYELDLNRSEYTIDSVVFHCQQYFEEPVLGQFEDKVLVNSPDEKTMFPRVKSYRSDYCMKNFMKDIGFAGGIGMMGNRIDVFGSKDNKAVFSFHRNGTKIASVLSQHFLMSADGVLVTDHASARVYLHDSLTSEVDSIYHNDLGFRYENGKRRLMLFRSEKGYGAGPFHDLYHDLDIYLESMTWNLDDNVMEFKRMEGVGKISEGDVVSVNYFRDDEFAMLRGLDGMHPMIRMEKFLQGYAGSENPNRFMVGDLCNYLTFPMEQVVSLMLRLQSLGYVEYDADEKSAVVLPRFYDVLESFRKNIDYDVIKLHTVTNDKSANIRLDLNTNDLILFGITSTIDGVEGPAVSLSDRKRVVIVPDNGRLVFKKNRDFRFSGGVIAGMFEFFTKDCLFNYDAFMIEMAKVDSLRFYARSDNHVIAIDGTLEKLQGRLLIDQGDNKSSRRETPDYPIFHSDANAYKFYRDINGGVFDPGDMDSINTADDLNGKFYYHLYPFVVDSLCDLSISNIAFEGELVSGGIFHNIKQPLAVMDDYSLGFVHRIGQNENDAYPMFDGSGRFHRQICLSEHGFYGEGRLDYQTAEFDSERFMFYLDSVTTITNRFSMKPREDGTMFPLATADALKLKWDVGKSVLTTETIDHPICMYGDTYFTGKTTLDASGYQADGKMRFGLTAFESEDFAFDARTFVADSAKFVLYSSDSTTVAFAATNYRADVDFDSQKVQYNYLDASSNLDFPMNQFVCTLKEAEWDMASNQLHLYNPGSSNDAYSKAVSHDELLAVRDNASKFISLVPEHDSLEFYSTRAEYDMNNYVIHAHDVKIIRLADAAFFPYLQDIDITAESKFEPVSGALLADTTNRYHLFNDALVNIKSRRDYSAQAYWDYQSVDGIRTPVRFDSIAPIDGVTHGYAHLPDSVGFQLSPQFAFAGRLTLDAKDEWGFFDGQFALIDFDAATASSASLSDTISLGNNKTEGDDASSSDSIVLSVQPELPLAEPIIKGNAWFASATSINPHRIAIPIVMDNIRKTSPDVCVGLYYEQAIAGGYVASFLTTNERRADLDEVYAFDGLLTYDADSVRFVINDTQQRDASLCIDKRGVITGQGNFDLGFDKGLTDFVCRGTYAQYPNDSLILDVLNVMQLPIFDDQILETIAEVYAKMDAESIDLTKTHFVDYFSSENNNAKTESLTKSIELEGYPSIAAKDFYNRTIVIPDLKMVWNDALHAFVSVGKIGLGNLGTHVVNKYVDGYVVFDHRLGNITYYFCNDLFMTYINYNCGDGQLQVHATYGDVNTRIYDTKERDRSITRDGKAFNYVSTPYDALLNFLNTLKYAGFQ